METRRGAPPPFRTSPQESIAPAKPPLEPRRLPTTRSLSDTRLAPLLLEVGDDGARQGRDGVFVRHDLRAEPERGRRLPCDRSDAGDGDARHQRRQLTGAEQRREVP